VIKLTCHDGQGTANAVACTEDAERERVDEPYTRQLSGFQKTGIPRHMVDQQVIVLTIC